MLIVRRMRRVSIHALDLLQWCRRMLKAIDRLCRSGVGLGVVVFVVLGVVVIFCLRCCRQTWTTAVAQTRCDSNSNAMPRSNGAIWDVYGSCNTNDVVNKLNIEGNNGMGRRDGDVAISVVIWSLSLLLVVVVVSIVVEWWQRRRYIVVSIVFVVVVVVVGIGVGVGGVVVLIVMVVVKI